jgi:hypothetical protein
MCFTMENVGTGTMKVALANQYMNLVAVLNIFIMLMVTRTLTIEGFGDGQDQVSILWMLSLSFVVPFAGCHYLQYRRTGWKIEGSLTSRLNVSAAQHTLLTSWGII